MVPSFLKDAVNQDWKVERLDALLKSKDILGHLDGNHGNLYPRSSEFVDSGIKYISANSLIDGKVNLSKSKYLTHERGAQFKKGVAINGDVLFAHNATVGPVALLTTNDDYVILSTSLTYYRCALDKVDNKYLVQYMASPAFVRQYEKIMKQTTRNQIPITAQRDFYFVLPPLPEQRKIAQILSTWDKAIATIQKLIDTNQQQKKALMQQLLTGKKRLIDPKTGKAFEGEWKSKSPISLFKLFSGFAFKSSDATDSGTKWLKIANVGIGEIKWDADSFLPRNFLSEHKKFLLTKGDIVVALTRPTLGNKLKVARLTKESDTSLLNQRVAKIVCKNDVNSEFIFQVLRSDQFAHRINIGLLGTDPPNLSVKVLDDFVIAVPPYQEQQKIASVLTAADKEIELLQAKLAHLKEEKKALMQQLLTGKRRVPISE